MLKRKISSLLLEWKNQVDRVPLIIKGARQVGKTFSVLEFGHSNYPHVIYLNFDQNPNYKTIFNDSLEVDHLIFLITAITGKKAIANKTLIIMDEIQECPNARTALKFFKLDGRYDVIATGSLLGIRGYNPGSRLIPVGYERHVTMHSLDFEEFLWANNIGEETISLLQKSLANLEPIPKPLHSLLMNLFHQYICVGGMPEAVNKFCDTHDMAAVLEVQRRIVTSYFDDVTKYAPTADKGKISSIFRSIPNQLAKENKKFQYSKVVKRGTGEMFSGALDWLIDAGIVVPCYNLSTLQLPLVGNAIDNIFKLYMQDAGLLVSMLEPGSQGDILSGNLRIYKGAIFENIIADFFVKMGRPLFYYRKRSGLEIDFVIRYKGKVVIVEVKSSDGNAKSAKEILKNSKYDVDCCIKLGDRNIGVSDDGIMTLPLYMAFLLTDY